MNKIAVFTSGGDAPGMNAAVRAVVRTATHFKLHVYGIMRAYDGMISGEVKRLETSDVANIIHRGGTILKTARSEEFRTAAGRKKAYDTLIANDIDGVIAIGGNGTFTGAKVFFEEFGIPFIGIPGTIDNDLFGTDYTIGFDTAVNTAIDAVDKIRDTADSHNRLFFIEVMGRDTGYIAMTTGIGSGAGGILIPENNKDVSALIEHLKLNSKRGKLFSLIIVAEGNKEGSAIEIADLIKQEFTEYETKVTIIGHLQRGGSPTSQDRMLASRLGFNAVKALMNGHSNEMVGLVNGLIQYTSFDDAINKKKAFDNDLLEMAEILSQ